MDEDTLNAAMRILNMAKVLESHGKLNRLMDMLGDCTEITWDNQCMVERFACESVFQNNGLWRSGNSRSLRRDKCSFDAHSWLFSFNSPFFCRWFSTACGV